MSIWIFYEKYAIEIHKLWAIKILFESRKNYDKLLAIWSINNNPILPK